jgi:hypothetical protein
MIVIITKKGIVAVQGGAETIRVLGTIGGQVLDDIAKVIGSIDDAQSLLDVFRNAFESNGLDTVKSRRCKTPGTRMNPRFLG